MRSRQEAAWPATVHCASQPPRSSPVPAAAAAAAAAAVAASGSGSAAAVAPSGSGSASSSSASAFLAAVSAAGSGAAAAHAQQRPRLPASRTQSKDASASPTSWRTEQGVGLEAEEEEREDRVVIDGPRPLGLEIEPAEEGYKGAVVRQSEGQAAAAGVEPGSKILSINDNPVEDMATSEIQGMLDRDALPMVLDLRPPLELLTVRKRKRKRDPVTVYTAGCRGSYRVVSEAVEHLGWLELRTNTDALNKVPSVIWLEHSDSTDGIAPVQTVSRLEAFLHFCKKARLAHSLNQWFDALPEVFAFSPQTWVLPYNAAELRTAMMRTKKDETFILKPTAGAQGKGIILAKKWKDIENLVSRSKASQENHNKATLEYVVQRYITSPLLLDGLKFDMRLYVVVTSVVPMRAYLFKEGLARFCTVPYEPPSEGNLKEAKMHLTNFAVNKKSKDFQPSEGLAAHDEGSKRSTSGTLRQIQQAFGVSPEEVWGKVATLIANTLMALRPALVEYYVHEQPRPLHPLGPKGFQLIGLDVIIDSDLEPRLLELNANPSLSVVQPDMNKGAEPPAAADAASGSGGAASSSGAADGVEAVALGASLGSSSSTHNGHHPSASSSSSSAPILPAATGIGHGIAALALPPAVPQQPTAPQVQTAMAMTLPSTVMQMNPSVNATPNSRAFQVAKDRQQNNMRRSRSSVVVAPQFMREDPQVTISNSMRRPGSADPPAPRGAAVVGQSSSSSGSGSGAAASVVGRRKGRGSRSRTRGAEGAQLREASKEKNCVTSELDLEIKRELVVQALLLTRPAPQNKAARLKKQWKPRTDSAVIGLNDEGGWALGGKATRAEAVRPDAPERCPALEPLDFEDLAAPEVFEYSNAHLQLYRWFVRACGNSRDSLGQAQVQRLLERNGLVGDQSGALFPDRVTAQLWLSRVWRELAPGNYGLNLPQLVTLAGRIGHMLEDSAGAADMASGSDTEEPPPKPSHIMGVLAFFRRGLCNI
mmetsp:Transcript_57260/g.145428  ORF Transcript_57260/g.145428 Transcript_57260/m.145428 type:complete len:991 (+) Transcript_57260:454-3426(+)